MFETVLALVLIPFGVLSAAALWQVGYLGLFTQQFADYGKLQVLVDLLIAVSVCRGWRWVDVGGCQENRTKTLALVGTKLGFRLVRTLVLFVHTKIFFWRGTVCITKITE